MADRAYWDRGLPARYTVALDSYAGWKPAVSVSQVFRGRL